MKWLRRLFGSKMPPARRSVSKELARKMGEKKAMEIVDKGRKMPVPKFLNQDQLEGRLLGLRVALGVISSPAFEKTTAPPEVQLALVLGLISGHFDTVCGLLRSRFPDFQQSIKWEDYAKDSEKIH